MLVETMSDQTFVCFTLRTLTVIRIQTISITKVNDKDENLCDTGTNRCCFLNSLVKEVTVRRRLTAITGPRQHGAKVLESEGDQTFLCFKYLFRSMNSGTNPDDVNYEDQR